MTVFEMPLIAGSYDYEIRTTLEGGIWIFRFRWNERAASWMLDLSDADGVPLAHGIRITVDVSLLEQYKHLAIPPGRFFAFDTTLRQVDPTVDDFGTRVLLLYNDSTEGP